MFTPSNSDSLEQSYNRQYEKLLKLQEVANKAVNDLFSGLTFYTAIFTISAHWFHGLQCKFFAMVVATTAATFLSGATLFYFYYQDITRISNEVASVELELRELDHNIINAVSATVIGKIKLKNLKRRTECCMQASKSFTLKYYLILLAAIVATLIFASSFQFGVYNALCIKKKWN